MGRNNKNISQPSEKEQKLLSAPVDKAEESHSHRDENNRFVPGLQRVSEYMDFAKFLATPTPLRAQTFDGVKTEAQFAEKYSLGVVTLWRWKQKKDFWDKVEQYRNKWGRARTADVLGGLYRRAIKYGMAQEVELWLAYFEGWDKKQIIEAMAPRFAEDDVRSLIAQLPEEQQNRFHELFTELLTEVSITQKRDETRKRDEQRPEIDT